MPLFVLVQSGVAGVAWATVILGAGLGLTYGAQAAWYAESFPASVRFSGVSIAYAIGAVIGGAFAPTIAQALLQATGTTWAIVGYLLVTVVISVIGTLLLRDRTGVPLSIEFEQSSHFDTWKRGDTYEVLSPVDEAASAELAEEGFRAATRDPSSFRARPAGVSKTAGSGDDRSRGAIPSGFSGISPTMTGMHPRNPRSAVHRMISCW